MAKPNNRSIARSSADEVVDDVPSGLRRVRLGRSRVEVTRFILGCAPLGGLYQSVDEEEATATLEAAWQLGVRAFDTAPHYGAGLSEQRVGHFLVSKPRTAFVLSTKVGRLLVDDAEGHVPARGFPAERPVTRLRDYSGDGVRRSLEESLSRLGLSRVDVALVHDPEDYLDEALAGAFPALQRLREEGIVGAIGAGMNRSGPLERIVREADIDCALIAGRYSLLDQSAGRSLLPACTERGVTVLAAGVFNGDVLANPRPGSFYDYQPAGEEIIERARAIGEVCSRHGVTLAAAALQFPLRHPAIGAIVVGVRTPAEVEADLGYLEQAVPEALYEELVECQLVDALVW